MAYSGSETKKNSKETIIIKAGMVFVSGGGVGGGGGSWGARAPLLPGK